MLRRRKNPGALVWWTWSGVPYCSWQGRPYWLGALLLALLGLALMPSRTAPVESLTPCGPTYDTSKTASRPASSTTPKQTRTTPESLTGPSSPGGGGLAAAQNLRRHQTS